MKHRTNLKKLIVSAVLAALCCVATMLIQIPSPMNGYVNMGDAVVLYSAYSLSPLYASAAAGIGSALADILTGYAYYAPGTFIIKAAMGAVASIIFNRIKGEHELPKMLTGGLAAEAIMIIGYLGYAALILGNGFAAAAASLPGNLLQAAVGLSASSVIFKLMPKKVRYYARS